MDDRKRVNPKPETEMTPADGRPETCQPETGNRINTSRCTTGNVSTRNRIDTSRWTTGKRVNPKPETELIPADGRPETCQPETGNRINTNRWTTANVSTRNRRPNKYKQIDDRKRVNPQMDDRKRVNPKPETELIPADGRPETCQPETGNRINTGRWTTGNVSTRNRKPN